MLDFSPSVCLSPSPFFFLFLFLFLARARSLILSIVIIVIINHHTTNPSTIKPTRAVNPRRHDSKNRTQLVQGIQCLLLAGVSHKYLLPITTPSIHPVIHPSIQTCPFHK